MSKTRHLQKRMAKRSIRGTMLKIVSTFGVPDGDKRVLNRKGCDAVLAEIEDMKKNLVKMRERGGMVLVENGGVQITTYALDSYSRNRVGSHQ